MVRWLEADGQAGAAALVRFLRATGCRPSGGCCAMWCEFTFGGEMPHHRSVTRADVPPHSGLLPSATSRFHPEYRRSCPLEDLLR